MSNSVAKRIQRTWGRVRLFIGFHRDPEGILRAEPKMWSPKNASATIKDDPKDTEVFCVVSSAAGDRNQDVQIKLHPDKIVLRRDADDYWKGIVVSEFDVHVQVGGTWIRIGHDGGVKRQKELDTTYIEADGSVLKETPYSRAMISADGEELSSSTQERISSITPEGVLSRPKNNPSKR
ncbi:hypothetical protein [Phaeobacter piscinae]|uniref:hypothetical protein n=1 Tax=Phaeobacter piscinae TaxID=1580596 RepID=UPI00058D2CD1|nr:hypothetical protein [Phaeobacter piscinae]UTS82740.1 hypothetical protein OL67_003850 [Phaeobacter piscinae]